jgi:hypothetical protein
MVREADGEGWMEVRCVRWVLQRWVWMSEVSMYAWMKMLLFL